MHTLIFTVAEAPSLDALRAWALQRVERWMDAVRYYVKHTRFTSGAAVARHVGIPAAEAETAAYNIPLSAQDAEDFALSGSCTSYQKRQLDASAREPGACVAALLRSREGPAPAAADGGGADRIASLKHLIVLTNYKCPGQWTIFPEPSGRMVHLRPEKRSGCVRKMVHLRHGKTVRVRPEKWSIFDMGKRSIFQSGSHFGSGKMLFL